jgi:mannose-6-phosphate isomerase-like protein (cupin superfamily)
MKPSPIVIFPIFALSMLASVRVAPQEQSYQPHSFQLECAGSDCPLLTGAPETTGMRSGFVRLQPGESVGAHSTSDHEEALVILQGKGKAEVEGSAAVPLAARMLIYIPPRARHNVTNTGTEPLEYVYVVAAVGNKLN